MKKTPRIWVSRMNFFFLLHYNVQKNKRRNGVVNPALIKGSFLQVRYVAWAAMVRITLSPKTPHTFKKLFKGLKSEKKMRDLCLQHLKPVTFVICQYLLA